MSDGVRAYMNYPGCIHCVDFTHARRYFIEAMEVRPDLKEFRKLKTVKDRKGY